MKDYNEINKQNINQLSDLGLSIPDITNRPEIIIGPAFAANFYLMHPLTRKQTNVEMPKIYFFNHEIGMLDKTIDVTTGIEGKFILCRLCDEDCIEHIGYTLLVNTPSVEFKSWAIVTSERVKTDTYEDKNGDVASVTNTHNAEIILACNKSNEKYASVSRDGETIMCCDIITFMAMKDYKVILTGEKLLKLGDFGLDIDSETSTGELVCYFCKSAVGKPIDEKAEHYKITLCECKEIKDKENEIKSILGEVI